jgi:hypothetical protein
MLSNATGWAETMPSTQQTFADVPPPSTFWVYSERWRAEALSRRV